MKLFDHLKSRNKEIIAAGTVMAALGIVALQSHGEADSSRAAASQSAFAFQLASFEQSLANDATSEYETAAPGTRKFQDKEDAVAVPLTLDNGGSGGLVFAVPPMGREEVIFYEAQGIDSISMTLSVNYDGVVGQAQICGSGCDTITASTDGDINTNIGGHSMRLNDLNTAQNVLNYIGSQADGFDIAVQDEQQHKQPAVAVDSQEIFDNIATLIAGAPDTSYSNK